MFLFKKKDKDKDKDKDSKKVQFNSGLVNDKEKVMPLGQNDDYCDDIIRCKTVNPENSEFEVWRAVKNKNGNNNKDLVLTEYLEKSKNDEENALKNKTTFQHQISQERIKVIEDYFNKDTQKINPNNNIDEDYQDNSDQEIEKNIHKKRQNDNDNENDDDDEEDERRFSQIRNKSRSKKVINKKVIGIDEDNKKEFPNFSGECKFYGENKEKYKVKITINSTFYVVFSAEKKNNFKIYNSNYYQFPLLSIKNYITTKKKRKYVVDIILKDYRSFSFKLSQDDFNLFNDVIQEFGMPNQNPKYFRHAYYYHSEFLKKEKSNKYVDGWKIYNAEEEFKYQELDFTKTFRKVDNSKFEFCASYPKTIVVPISMTDEDIMKCGTFRTKERIPALTYRYKKNGKCIWRSSQTKSGIKGKTNPDVILLTKIAEGSKKLFVFDARPLLNAWANKLKGAGYEDVSQYSDINMELQFCGIPNIHAVRGSCHKVYSTLCFKNENEEKKKAKSNTDSGNWYDSIIILIKGAFKISEEIKNDNTVLVHCSDGWDRTTQLCATSQLILDKRYRTLDGFICLIEKDWLSFGHQFRYRCGMYCPSDSPSNVASENQKSPVFIQWLDAVYQIMHQNITKFEFNTELLFCLANEVFTGKYGTFLFNNEQERDIYNAREKTVSIWTYVKENETKFLNALYDPEDNSPFNMNYKRIQLWNRYFFRFEEGEDNYDEKVTKLANDLKNTIDKDKQMINELINFINKKCPKADISSLTSECQELIKKYSTSIKK